MPVNAGTAQLGEIFDAKKGHVPHWSTCPFAKEFRKAHPKPEEPAAPRPVLNPDESYEQLEVRLRAKGVIK